MQSPAHRSPQPLTPAEKLLGLLDRTEREFRDRIDVLRREVAALLPESRPTPERLTHLTLPGGRRVEIKGRKTRKQRGGQGCLSS